MNEYHQTLLTPVMSAFTALLQQMHDLSDRLTVDQGPIWIQSGDREVSQDREALIDVISQIEYIGNQEGRETLVRPGLIGVSEETLNLVKAVNCAKSLFKMSVLNFKAASKITTTIQFHHYINQVLDNSPLMLRQAMRSEGFSRLHLRQCYRHLPVLEVQPYKVSWTWTHTRSIQKISLIEAEQRLLKMQMDAGITQQLQKLKLLSPVEFLAIVQELSPHCCANIILDESKTQRKMLKSPIPIFYLIDPEKPLPIVIPPTTCREKNPERRERSDIKIDREVYLPSIRAHRYITEYSSSLKC